MAAYGYSLILTICTLALDEVIYHRYKGMNDRVFLLLWALLENFGYRQLTVIWRLRGLIKFLRGQTGWGAMERRSLKTSA